MWTAPADVPTEFVAYQYYLRLVPTTSIVSRYERRLNPTLVSRESSSSLTSSPSVSLSSNGPLHLLNSSYGLSLLPFGFLSPFSSLVSQLCWRHRWRIRLRILGPPHYRPDDIGRRRPRRHQQHRAPRFRPERRPAQQMDWRGPPRPSKHRILAPRRMDRRGWRRRFSPTAARPTAVSQATPALRLRLGTR